MTTFLLKFFGTMVGLLLGLKVISIIFSWCNYALNCLKPNRKKAKTNNNQVIQ